MVPARGLEPQPRVFQTPVTHLDYTRRALLWCQGRESNPLRSALQANALPMSYRGIIGQCRVNRTLAGSFQERHATTTLYADNVFGSTPVHEGDLAAIRRSSTVNVFCSVGWDRTSAILGLRLTAGRITTLPRPSKTHFMFGSPSRHRT